MRMSLWTERSVDIYVIYVTLQERSSLEGTLAKNEATRSVKIDYLSRIGNII